MERYIGVDAHSQTCTLRVLTASGKEVTRQVVETNGAALVQAIRAIAGTKHVCVEEGTQSAWIYELLKNEVDELVVTMPARRAGQKDDARDALGLAEGLRTGAIRQRVYKACGPYSELRAAVRSYVLLREDVTRAKNRLKALYRSRGIATPGDGVYRADTHLRWQRLLPAPQQQSASVLFSQVESLMDLWTMAEKRLITASKPQVSIMEKLASRITHAEQARKSDAGGADSVGAYAAEATKDAVLASILPGQQLRRSSSS